MQSWRLRYTTLWHLQVLENQESCSTIWSESEVLRQQLQYLRAGENGYPSSSRERERKIIHPSSAFLFYWSRQRMVPTYTGEGRSSLLRLLIQMLISSGNILTHTEIVFYQLSRHPLAQSSWHIKLTITVTEARQKRVHTVLSQLH